MALRLNSKLLNKCTALNLNQLVPLTINIFINILLKEQLKYLVLLMYKINNLLVINNNNNNNSVKIVVLINNSSYSNLTQITEKSGMKLILY